MTVEDVIELINKRRRQHIHSPVGDDSGDPLRWSDGGFHSAMVQEYDALLDEIRRVETKAERRQLTKTKVLGQ